MTDKISDAVIDEMLAGLEGVTPGPYYQRENCVMAKGRCVARLDWEITDETDRLNEAHLTRCSPETIGALLKELRAYRTAANPLQAVLEKFTLDGEEEKRIDAMRLAAFKSNDEKQLNDYYRAVSKWFQDRHYRYLETTPAPVSEPLTLDARELDTILAIGRNEQSGRITNYELMELVRVYRAAHLTATMGGE